MATLTNIDWVPLLPYNEIRFTHKTDPSKNVFLVVAVDPTVNEVGVLLRDEAQSTWTVSRNVSSAIDLAIAMGQATLNRDYYARSFSAVDQEQFSLLNALLHPGGTTRAPDPDPVSTWAPTPPPTSPSSPAATPTNTVTFPPSGGATSSSGGGNPSSPTLPPADVLDEVSVPPDPSADPQPESGWVEFIQQNLFATALIGLAVGAFAVWAMSRSRG